MVIISWMVIWVANPSGSVDYVSGKVQTWVSYLLYLTGVADKECMLP